MQKTESFLVTNILPIVLRQAKFLQSKLDTISNAAANPSRHLKNVLGTIPVTGKTANTMGC